MRIITEEDATSVGVLEVVGSDKLYNKSQATALKRKREDEKTTEEV